MRKWVITVLAACVGVAASETLTLPEGKKLAYYGTELKLADR
jgi:hypothetical protein